MCPDCHATAELAVLRTDVAVYFHCSRCGRLWSNRKPIDTLTQSPDADP